MKSRNLKLLLAIFAVVLSFSTHTVAQSDWLDMKTLPNWNSRSRAILQTKKMRQSDLNRCRNFVRTASLPADQLLTRNGWTLVGPAQVFGRTTVVTVADSFDGMCRPLKFQTLVFVGNRVAGTLSPGPMDSRTDGSLTNVRLLSPTNLTAEYVRYRETDALCCPWKTEAVVFNIKPDGANFLLTPENSKVGSVGIVENQAADAGELKNTVWRWDSLETPTAVTAVDKPENYQIEFTADGKVRVQADCNRGNGAYQASAGKLHFSNIALTRAMCPPGSLDNRFLRGLGAAQDYRIEGNTLLIELADDGGTMRFNKVSRQN
ncbi:MAG: META domain-containing protein [Pyrinomonadaceae bacterium]